MSDYLYQMPPRPEEDLAAAEEYRLCATLKPNQFVVITDHGPERLRLRAGHVLGFDTWFPRAPHEVQAELTREILDLGKHPRAADA